jgi:hypothetical protein
MVANSFPLSYRLNDLPIISVFGTNIQTIPLQGAHVDPVVFIRLAPDIHQVGAHFNRSFGHLA